MTTPETKIKQMLDASGQFTSAFGIDDLRHSAKMEHTTTRSTKDEIVIFYGLGITWHVPGEYEPRIQVQSQLHRQPEVAVYYAIREFMKKLTQYNNARGAYTPFMDTDENLKFRVNRWFTYEMELAGEVAA